MLYAKFSSCFIMGCWLSSEMNSAATTASAVYRTSAEGNRQPNVVANVWEAQYGFLRRPRAAKIEGLDCPVCMELLSRRGAPRPLENVFFCHVPSLRQKVALENAGNSWEIRAHPIHKTCLLQMAVVDNLPHHPLVFKRSIDCAICRVNVRVDVKIFKSIVHYQTLIDSLQTRITSHRLNQAIIRGRDGFNIHARAPGINPGAIHPDNNPFAVLDWVGALGVEEEQAQEPGNLADQAADYGNQPVPEEIQVILEDPPEVPQPLVEELPPDPPEDLPLPPLPLIPDEQRFMEMVVQVRNREGELVDMPVRVALPMGFEPYVQPIVAPGVPVVELEVHPEMRYGDQVLFRERPWVDWIVATVVAFLLFMNIRLRNDDRESFREWLVGTVVFFERIPQDAFDNLLWRIPASYRWLSTSLRLVYTRLLEIINLIRLVLIYNFALIGEIYVSVSTALHGYLERVRTFGEPVAPAIQGMMDRVSTYFVNNEDVILDRDIMDRVDRTLTLTPLSPSEKIGVIYSNHNFSYHVFDLSVLSTSVVFLAISLHYWHLHLPPSHMQIHLHTNAWISIVLGFITIMLWILVYLSYLTRAFSFIRFKLGARNAHISRNTIIADYLHINYLTSETSYLANEYESFRLVKIHLPLLNFLYLKKSSVSPNNDTQRFMQAEVMRSEFKDLDEILINDSIIYVFQKIEALRIREHYHTSKQSRQKGLEMLRISK